MWSLAGNQAIDQPIQQLRSLDAQGALAWAACACSRGIQLLLGLGRSQAALCLERAASQPCAWRACSRRSQRPCAWEAYPAALGLSLSGGRGRPGTESRGTRFRGFGPVGGAASLCSRCSRRFQVWAPLRGFMYGPPFANLRARNQASGEPWGSGAAYPALAVQGRRGEGRQGPRLLRRVL